MRRLMLFFIGTALLMTGCNAGSTLPKTFPVTGKVLTAKGTPVTGGQVQFDSAANPNVTVTGIIESDGSFVLKTFRDRSDSLGAPEGEYKVTVSFPIASGNAPPPPVTLPKTYRVEARDNNFEIRLLK